MGNKKPIPIATDRKRSDNRGKPRIAEHNELASDEMVRKWFCDALKSVDPKPSLDACGKLARKIQIIINRANNSEHESCGSVLLDALKDPDPNEEFERRLQTVIGAGKDLLAAIRDLEEYAGGFIWEGPDGTVCLSDIEGILYRIGVITPATENPSVRTRKQPWHAPARKIAHEIKSVLIEASYSGSLSMTDGNGAIAKIGTPIINRAYGISIDAEGFASAMRLRDRRQREKSVSSFSKRYPEAKRIKIF
jgi:hypothetical protein